MFNLDKFISDSVPLGDNEIKADGRFRKSVSNTF